MRGLLYLQVSTSFILPFISEEPIMKNRYRPQLSSEHHTHTNIAMRWIFIPIHRLYIKLKPRTMQIIHRSITHVGVHKTAKSRRNHRKHTTYNGFNIRLSATASFMLIARYFNLLPFTVSPCHSSGPQPEWPLISMSPIYRPGSSISRLVTPIQKTWSTICDMISPNSAPCYINLHKYPMSRISSSGPAFPI